MFNKSMFFLTATLAAWAMSVLIFSPYSTDHILYFALGLWNIFSAHSYYQKMKDED
jgi:hypothetical protein